MGEETGTLWMSVRESIKDKLNECEYIEAFTIEDHATEFSSTQFFSWKVREADVVIILIKEEIRPGTNQEIEMAIEKGKPILVYFVSSESPKKSVTDFKEQIIARDITTFKQVDSFENLEEIVLNDVINNVISFYRFTHDVSIDEKNDSYFTSELLFEDNFLDKKFLDFFGSNKNAWIDYFSLSRYSRKDDSEIDENSIGIKLLNWLYKGEYFTNEEEFSTLIKESALPENVTEVLKIRQKSTRKYYDDDLEGALKELDKAYQLAEESKLPEWLLGDILIDCRNIQGKARVFDQKYQDEINSLSTFIYFPVGDRFVKEAFEILDKERLEIRTLSASTTRYGNTLLNSLEHMENYLYVSFFIGSSTHLLVARKRTIELFIEYGEIYEDENLIYQALKLIILAGEVKLFSKIIQQYWDEINDILAANVKNLWELTSAKYSVNNKVMKCLIMKSLGQYMDDTLFIKVMVFILDYSKEYTLPDEGKYVLGAVNNNLKRFNKDFVLEILLSVLKSNKVILYSDITKLLSNIDLDGCKSANVIELSKVLEENIDIILRNNGTPYFIINLLNMDKNVFNDLYKLIKDKVHEEQLDYIEIELGDSGKAKKILEGSIKELERRFDSENQNGVYFGYANDPLAVIISIIQEHNDQNIVELINKKFLPLTIKVLASKASLEVKEPYLEALVTMLIGYKKEKLDVPEEIKIFFSQNSIKLHGGFAIAQSSLVSSEYYINTISSLLGIDTEDSIFATCITYKEKTRNERVAFSYSIQNYIEYNLISEIKPPKFIMLVVLEMLRDGYFVVRKNALKCLILIYKSTPSKFLKGELIRMTMDSSPNLKGFYIELLKSNYFILKDEKELLLLFSKDASYNVRESSKNSENNEV